MINANIFRQYDIRGVADRDLTPKVVNLLGRAIGIYLKQLGIKEMAVGADNRLSSPRLRESLSAGLLSEGCRVIDLGTVVTPMVYFSVDYFGIGGAVMITGSHNPPGDNGFKIAIGRGTIYGEKIAFLHQIMKDIISLGLSLDDSIVWGSGCFDSLDVVTPYLAMLKEKICLGPRRIKVALDCGNGTASLFADRILCGWGCEVVPLYCESDGRFPHHQPDPVKTANLIDLRRTVIEKKCDLGVAYDGDADRIGVIDERGNIIWGDTLMALFWREILEMYPGAPAIIEVKCSQALIDEIQRMGGKTFFYKTGHSLIKAKMREVNAPFSGEMSGHMFFADEYYGFDDAFYATGRLLRILSNTEFSLSQLLEGIPSYYSTAETRVPCPDEHKFAAVNRLVGFFRQSYEVIDVDGARVLFGDGWGLVRASNTQPVLVARCEATTKKGLERICMIMKDALLMQGRLAKFDWEW